MIIVDRALEKREREGNPPTEDGYLGDSQLC